MKIKTQSPVFYLGGVYLVLLVLLAFAWFVHPAAGAELVIAGAAVAVPDVVTVGFGHAAGAYADENGRPVTEAPLPLLANHHFSVDGDGNLVHRIEGRLRAIVPPAGLRDYARLWPDALPIIKTLLGQAGAVRAPAGKRSSAARRPSWWTTGPARGA